MKTRRLLVPLGALGWAVALLVAGGLVLAQETAPQGRGASGEPIGTAFTYQGRLVQGGEPVTAICDMDFLLYDDADKGDQVGTTIAAAVPITDGYFTRQLDFGGKAFVYGEARWLEVQIECPGDTSYTKLPRQELTAAPFATFAKHTRWDGIGDMPEGFSDDLDGVEYADVIVVAKSGGDYASVQAGIDGAGARSAQDPALVWIAPGVYAESVSLRPHVHLRGSGQHLTAISSTVSNSSWPPSAATLVLTRNTTVADLRIVNPGAGSYKVGVLAGSGVTGTALVDIAVLVDGGGTNHHGLVASGPGTALALTRVDALSEDGSWNYGLTVRNGADIVADGGSFVGRGGSNNCRGIFVTGTGTHLAATGVTARGTGCALYNYGVDNFDGGHVTLDGCSNLGSGGTYARGIYNAFGAELVGTSSVLRAQGGAGTSMGLYNRNAGVASLRHGSIQACGGGDATGIRNDGAGSALELDGVIVTAQGDSNDVFGMENAGGGVAKLYGVRLSADGGATSRGLENIGSDTVAHGTFISASGTIGSYGLVNHNGGAATWFDGTIESSGGNDSWAVDNRNQGSTLEATGTTMRAADGLHRSFGVANTEGARAHLRDCTIQAEVGTDGTPNVYGIMNSHGSLPGAVATVFGDDLAVVAEGLGSSGCSAVLNESAGVVHLRGGTYVARHGWDSHALHNGGGWPGSQLYVTGVTAVSEGVPVESYALYNESLTLAEVGNSRLDAGDLSVVGAGGTVTVTLSTLGKPVSGTVSCVGVARGGTFMASGCP